MTDNAVAKSASPTPDLLDLAPNHIRFANLYLSGQYTLIKIAELMGVHVNTLNKWLKREDVSNYLSSVLADQHELVTMQLSAMTSKATNKLNSLIDSNIDGVALQAVKDVLDRGGHKAKQEVRKEVTITTYEQQISEVIASTMEDVIDVEYSEE